MSAITCGTQDIIFLVINGTVKTPYTNIETNSFTGRHTCTCKWMDYVKMPPTQALPPKSDMIFCIYVHIQYMYRTGTCIVIKVFHCVAVQFLQQIRYDNCMYPHILVLACIKSTLYNGPHKMTGHIFFPVPWLPFDGQSFQSSTRRWEFFILSLHLELSVRCSITSARNMFSPVDSLPTNIPNFSKTPTK